jgi:hypothetical protein
MIKNVALYMLIGLLLNLSFFHSTAIAGSKADKTAKIKASIIKLGVGKESKVEVKLFNKTKIIGYISEITEDSFTVMNEQENSKTEVPYPQVKQVKGNNFSKGVTIAIVAGIILVIAAIVGATSPD